MLLKEAIEKYGNYQVEEDKLKEILKPQGRYIPYYREKYFYLNQFGIIDQTDNGITKQDKYCIKHNLVFRTKEECEEYKKFIELLDEYTFEPDWNDEYQKKFIMIYGYSNNRIFTTDLHYNDYGSIYFESEEKIKKFIELAGEENVKKFMFNVWE